MMYWDNQILLFAATHRSDGLDGFFRAATWLGSLYLLAPLAVLIAGVLLSLHKRWEAGLLLIGFGGATLWVHLAKILLDRPRPDLVQPLIALPTDASFPSAHTMQIVAFALCMVLIIRRTLPEWQFAAMMVAFVLVVVVGASRVYLQVHFPSDVLGGVAFGIAWVALVYKIL
jgi:membrane-associated phospholipid phosphatase